MVLTVDLVFSLRIVPIKHLFPACLLRMSAPKLTMAKIHPPIQLYGYCDDEGQAVVQDTGSTTMVTFNNRPKMPYIMGGPLNFDVYIFAYLHMYCVDFPYNEKNPKKLTVLIVHYNSKYGSLEGAHSQTDGFAIILIHVDEKFIETCPDLKDFLSTAWVLLQKSSSAIINTGKRLSKSIIFLIIAIYKPRIAMMIL